MSSGHSEDTTLRKPDAARSVADTGDFSADDASDSASLPEAIGRYRIERLLGTGGYGIVYLAHDEQLHRSVAIKVPQPRRVTSIASAEPYLREARLVANLDHPHIVPVYDVGSSTEFPCFIVSKFIEGTSLAERLRFVRPSQIETVELVATIAEAMHYAHQQGLVHRDLKPGNVLLDRSNQPFIVDFGLALREHDTAHDRSYVGTPAYMSPEQARGEGHRVDGRSDIFSLGVILYELLVGRKPFQGTSAAEILDQVATREPRPPRQINDTIPKELERICLRALAKRAADRYTTARDFADDLRCFLDFPAAGDSSAATVSLSSRAPSLLDKDLSAGSTLHAAPISASQTVRIVPKGLRSFDERDADFFLALLPGPRDRTGLPESIRFWSAAIEETEADRTFAVGLIYGPSGCGKSSLVRAGLLPALPTSVISVYVEATPDGTEAGLLRALRHRCPALAPQSGLRETLAALRRGEGIPAGRKVLLILDQFEQWLHGREEIAGAELVEALRQCDGVRLQCLVLVRDDFYVAVNRFFQQLEVPIVEGRNYRLVDLFDAQHARKVLTAFGRAFARLPQATADLTRDQEAFLDQAVQGLSQDGKVISVRLALFSEMMKGRDWTIAGLRKVGGTEGVGAAFLEETFSGPQAPPTHRFHQSAARAILKALLPPSGSDLKGQFRSFDELRTISGYDQRPDEFRRLLIILEYEVRLIVPRAGDDSVQDDSQTDRGAARHYQLTHDYLVPAVREWLTRKQKESRRGRAQLLLESLAAEWNSRPEVRRLPSLLEWLSIRWWASPHTSGAAAQRMLRAADRYFAARAVLGLCLVLLLSVAAAQWQKVARRRDDAVQAQHLVRRLLSAESPEALPIIAEMNAHRDLVNPLLASALGGQSSDREKLHARLALLPADRAHLAPVLESALDFDPVRLHVVSQAIEPHAEDCRPLLWQIATDTGRNAGLRFRAACLLARVDPHSDRWAGIADQTAAELVGAQILLAPQWADQLHPVRSRLLPRLQELYRDPAAGERQRTMTSALLVEYLEDAEQLAELIQAGSYDQLAILLPLIRRQGPAVAPRLAAALDQSPQIEWPDATARPIAGEPVPETVERIESAGGFVTSNWAICQALPVDEFETLAADLHRAGYRPNSLRPYEASDRVLLAVVWLRDGRDWEWAYSQSPEDLRVRDREARSHSRWPFDLAATRLRVSNPDEPPAYTALWVELTSDLIEAAMYVGVPEQSHVASWQPLNEASFVPRTNLRVYRGQEPEYSSIRWKFARAFEYEDCWAEDPQSLANWQTGDWFQPDLRPTSNELGGANCSTVWWDCGGWSSKSCRASSLEDHLVGCRETGQAGYRPFSLTVEDSSAGSAGVVCSTWRRPLPTEAALDLAARRAANAALALLHLSRGDVVWPLLRQRPDPTLRTRMIHGFAPAGIDAALLWDRLAEESDASARRALLLGLAQYRRESGDEIDPHAADTVARIYANDPDPGVHSAAWVLLRALGDLQASARPLADPSANVKPPTSAVADGARPSRDANGARKWSYTAQGQLLAHVDGPLDFSMGSPGNETYHESYVERQHQVRIPRSFAISVTEVTVEDFQNFKRDFDYSHDYTPGPHCPITMVSYYDAMQYCRWLSDKEGFRQDEMCYPPIDKIGKDMTVPADCLNRPSYRLPTSAEWEAACRAGSATPRPFGVAADLLPRYAWTVSVPPYFARPVAQLLPNDLGLFDMLGNAMEFCQNTNLPFPRGRDSVPREDSLELAAFEAGGSRDRRGGAFLYQPADARSAHRDYGFPENRFPFLGFRIARTLPRPPARAN